MNLKKVSAVFYRTESGNEPVREFLRDQDDEDRRAIGKDIARAEYGWPIGEPTARPMGSGLHEIRTNLPRNRISRVFFYVSQAEEMVLLHAIIKKTRKTPPEALTIARDRMRKHKDAAKNAGKGIRR